MKKFNNMADCKFCLDKAKCDKQICKYRKEINERVDKPNRVQMVCAMARCIK